MSDLFAGVYGARFPEVVMNAGPLPPEGGLPAPLHDTPDARINYGSTLLGDLQPYAYGEAGYMSSQSQNNQPHRIQKIVPELFLPEPNGKEVFKLSHAVDDSDLAFVMRLNRHSIFCTGSRTSSRRSTKIGTSVDPLINLPTLNYLLAGLQTSMPLEPDAQSLWWEFLFNLDPHYWPREDKRTYRPEFEMHILPERYREPLQKFGFELEPFRVPLHEHRPFCLDDIVHVIRNCIKPFGIVRGSEKQGGQHEMGQGPVSWAVPAIATLVIDGKEANVVNMWHKKNLHAGDDLVLRLKLMPLKTYTLNHYYKGFARKSFEVTGTPYVWQLVPDVFEMDITETGALIRERMEQFPGTYDVKIQKTTLFGLLRYPFRSRDTSRMDEYIPWIHVAFECGYNNPEYVIPWQELGYWHIGRTQIRRTESGLSEFYNDDMANDLRTNHIDLTFQPVFQCLPHLRDFLFDVNYSELAPRTLVGKPAKSQPASWEPELRLERMQARPARYLEPPAKRAREDAGLCDLGPRAPPRTSIASGRASIQPAARVTWSAPDSAAVTWSAPDRAKPAARATWSAPDSATVTWSAPDRVKPAARATWSAPDRATVTWSAPDRAKPSARAAWSAPDSAAVTRSAPDSAAVTRSAPDGARPASTQPTTTAPAPARDPPLAAPSLDAPAQEPMAATGAAEEAGQPAGISQASREELLSGLPGAPAKTLPVKAVAKGKGRKQADTGGPRGPVEGTLLRPGAPPEACQMELL